MISKVSEKALELNVNENLVNRIRQFGGIYSRAFIYGFTLREEARHGFDSSINLPFHTNFLFSLQYKKPISRSNGRYRFMINTNGSQHVLLLISSFLFGENIWYAFPLFIDPSELSQNSPDFLSRTYFVRITNFPENTFDGNIHVVEIDEQSGDGFVHSDEAKKIITVKGEEFLEKIREFKTLKIEEIKAEKLSYEDVVARLEEFGVNGKILDKIREEKRKLFLRFSS